MIPDSTIYEPDNTEASTTSRPSQLIARLATGAILGAALWLILTTLGVPNVFHMLSMFGIIPFTIAGALVGITRFRRVLAYAVAVVLVAMIVIGYTPIIVSPALSLIRTDATPASADAIVVLSAGVTPDGLLHGQGLDRLIKGLQLIKAHVAPMVVVTRERRDIGGRSVSASLDQDSMAALAGVTGLIVTPIVASTRDEAVEVAAIARRSGWKRIVLVTSPFHSRRACATFEHTGLQVSCVPSDSRDIAVHSLAAADDRVRAFGMWIYEMAATLQYRRKGWM